MNSWLFLAQQFDFVALTAQLGVPALVATLITGIFAYKSKTTEHTRPDILSSSYAQLVEDLRHELVIIKEEVKMLKEKVTELQLDRDEEILKVTILQKQVDWLLQRLPAEYRKEYYERFGLAGPKG